MQDSWRAGSWADKLRLWLKAPVWRPADVAAAWPKAAFDIQQLRRFDPPLSRAEQWGATLLFGALSTGTSVSFWFAQQLSTTQQLLGASAIVMALWCVGRFTQPGRTAHTAAAPLKP